LRKTARRPQKPKIPSQGFPTAPGKPARRPRRGAEAPSMSVMIPPALVAPRTPLAASAGMWVMSMAAVAAPRCGSIA
jgi:hypothetical protein